MGLSKREALALAKKLLPRAKAGDLDDAAMLIDAAVYAGKPSTAEQLDFALRGRTYPAGVKLPPDAARRNLKDTLEAVEWSLFPPRRRPCMPNARELAELVSSAKLSDERTALRLLRKTLQEACNAGFRRAFDQAMERANEILRGFGVETVRVATADEGDLVFDYVNFGDTYVATLIYDRFADRFRVTSWGDMVEAWERRWGRVGEND